MLYSAAMPRISRYHILMIVLAGAAALYRILLILAYPQHIVGTDAQQYLILARNIVAGNPYSLWATPPFFPDVFRSPGYPFFLAIIFRCGGGLVAVCAIQTILQVIAVFFGAKCIEKMMNPAVGMGAYLFGLFSPFTAAVSCLVLSEALVIPLVTLFFVVALRPQRRLAPVIIGAVLGLLAVTRGLFVPAILLAVAAAAAGRPRSHGIAPFSRAAMRSAVAIAVSSAVFLAPYAIWNYSNHDALSVTPIAGMGRALVAQQGFVATEVTGEHWRIYENLWTERARPAPEEIVRIDNVMKKSSIAAIKRDPLTYLLRTLRNEIHIWFGVRFLFPFNNPMIPGIVLRCASIAILLLSFVAIARLDREWLDWTLALIPFLVTAIFIPFFYVNMRYSTPVYGPFELLAGAAIVLRCRS